ncbi:ATP-binding protein [Streptomyces sp. NBC_01190]|uniref:ATP-binding protein n=1 Tax=Streptomyces sp. NBC_01190 TaxID=2903767 RepID=UPI00386613E1|nr:ATP-binding protein [Streptomyces sp. NBC_01190]
MATNSVKYGKVTVVRVALSVRGGAATITVSDGTPYVPLPPVTAAAEDDENGRGLFLVEALATRWGAPPRRGRTLRRYGGVGRTPLVPGLAGVGADQAGLVGGYDELGAVTGSEQGVEARRRAAAPAPSQPSRTAVRPSQPGISPGSARRP